MSLAPDRARCVTAGQTCPAGLGADVCPHDRKIGSWILVGILLVGPRLLAPPMCDVSNGRRAQDYVVIGGLTKAAWS